MIPIGLYRNSNNFFFEETNQSYVYMCPSKDDLVDTNTDKIYLLANERSFTIVKQRREKVRRASSYIPIKETINMPIVFYILMHRDQTILKKWQLCPIE